VGKKLPPKQLELYQGIDEILWKDWDPADVSDSPDSRDEYYPYLPVVFNMALNGADSLEIAQYLSSVTQENMGLSANTNLDKVVAEKITQLKTQIGI
jgi:hypothetical protein